MIAPTGPSYTYRAVCKRVIDGDTTVVEADLGFEVFAAVHVRIRGVNAPELHGVTHMAGEASRAFLDALLLPAGQPAVALLLKSYARSFERWAGDLWTLTNREWVSVAEQIVAGGHGVPMKP